MPSADTKAMFLSLFLLCFEALLEESLQVLRLLLEEILLFLTFLFVVFLPLFNNRVYSINFCPERDYLFLLLSLPFLKLRLLLDQLSFSVFGLELFAHGEGD